MMLDAPAFSSAVIFLTAIIALPVNGFTRFADPPTSTPHRMRARPMLDTHHRSDPESLRCRSIQRFGLRVHRIEWDPCL